MSNFVSAALNTADLASKLTGIATDFLMGIGCEAFCEVLDIGKDVLFEAIKSGRIDHRTKKALENLDQRTVDDLKHFVSQELQKYSKKGKLPKKLKGKDLVDVFMNRLDTVSKLVDDYAERNKLSEDRRIALKYILNEIRQCTAQASLDMLETEDKRLVLVLSQIMRNIFEDYREDFAPQLAQTLFYRPVHCSYCAGSSLIYDDDKGIAASSGSACTSGSLDPSHVLLALGRPHEVAHGSLRLSLCEENTEEEVEYIIEAVKDVVSLLRGMSPVWRDLESGKKEFILK